MTQEQTQSLEQTLERTDFGHFVNQNKKTVLILSAVIVIGVLSYTIFNYQSSKADQKKLAELYQVSESVETILEPTRLKAPQVGVKNEEPKKLTQEDAQKLIGLVNNMSVDIAKMPSTVPLVLSVLNEIERAELEVDTTAVLEKYIKYYSPKESIYLYLGFKLAVVYENAGNTKGAIDILEKMVAANTKILEAKIYLDLGRLYLAEGQADKAKANFEYITKNHANTEYSKLADLYMMEM